MIKESYGFHAVNDLVNTEFGKSPQKIRSGRAKPPDHGDCTQTVTAVSPFR